MPSFSGLNDIAKELQSQTISALVSAADIDFTISTETLVLASPSSDLDDGVRACLYLYHVDIDPHLRNRRWMADPVDPTLMIKPPLPLQLRFLFVPVDAEEDNNQLMLGRVLQHFHDSPTFRPAPGSPLAISRGGAPEDIRVRPDLASHQDLATLWSGFAQPFRLCAGLLAEIVTLDSATAAMQVPRVGEMLGAADGKNLEEDA